MNADLLLLPVLVQILLTTAMFFALAGAKSKAVKAGQVNESRRALYDDAWPESVMQINNNIRNQFELPVLFYVLCLMLWGLESTSLWVHGLAWVFALSRLVHAQIHAGSNFVPNRRRAFMLGFFAVLGLAVFAVVEILRKSAA